MDKDFIKRATRITSFNLKPSDFTDLRYKKEIQHLFHTYFFPKFDVNQTLDSVDQSRLNTLINKLKAEDRDMFSKLHNYNLKGVGPGEATLYFLLNYAHLGGGSSAGVDLVDRSGKYEVKAVKVSGGVASDFKLGGTVPLSEIMTDLNNLRERLKLAGSKTEISGRLTDEMRTKAPKEFKLIEERYAKLAYEYFKGHKVIFINNGNNLGYIEAIKEVKERDITIERVTSGTVKPRVKL